MMLRPTGRLRTASWLAFACAVLWTGPVLDASSSHGKNSAQAGSTVLAGQSTFRQFCAACHGADGRGRGAVAPFLLIEPADLTHIRARNNGVFPKEALESILLAASRGSAPAVMSTQMMVWGPIFKSMDADPPRAQMRVEELLTFLESIQEQ